MAICNLSNRLGPASTAPWPLSRKSMKFSVPKSWPTCINPQLSAPCQKHAPRLNVLQTNLLLDQCCVTMGLSHKAYLDNLGITISSDETLVILERFFRKAWVLNTFVASWEVSWKEPERRLYCKAWTHNCQISKYSSVIWKPWTEKAHCISAPIRSQQFIHIHATVAKTPEEYFEGNYCVSYSNTKMNTTRMSVIRIMLSLCHISSSNWIT
jgi:hypothetical protein